VAYGRTSTPSHHLFSRLVEATETGSPSVRWLAARIVFGGCWYDLSGAGVTARHLRKSSSAGAHDSASLADDDCAAAVVTGEPISAAVIRSSPTYRSGSDPPVPPMELLQTTRTMADASKSHVDHFCDDDFGVARSSAL